MATTAAGEVGELDAGIVYASDVVSAGGRVEGIDIAASDEVFAEYSIAALAARPTVQVARSFVAFVLSPEGSAIMANHGFAAP